MSLSRLINQNLSDAVNPPGFSILEDSAFVVDERDAGGKIMRARKRKDTTEIQERAELAAIDIVLQPFIPSESQSNAWGLSAIKALFGNFRLKLSDYSQKKAPPHCLSLPIGRPKFQSII